LRCSRPPAVVTPTNRPADIITLSKWARTQTKEYSRIPSLDHHDFQIWTVCGGEKKLLFEANLQTPPTHSPLVTCWLKLFVVYDVDQRVETVNV